MKARCFYLAHPTTNRPLFIGASDDVLAERKRLAKERRSLRGSLIVTLPTMDATVDEQLAVWHRLYEVCDVLSSPPGDAVAPDDLVTKYGEWVDPADDWYAPLKPVSERRTPKRIAWAKCEECGMASTASGITMHQSASGHIGMESITRQEHDRLKTEQEQDEQERAEGKVAEPSPPSPSKPKPQPGRKRTTIFRCDQCDHLAKLTKMKAHQHEYSHRGKTPVYEDETATVREYVRQQALRRKKASTGIPSGEIRQCRGCDYIGKKGRMQTHQKRTGHVGENRLEQTPDLAARYAKLTVPESGLARCDTCQRLSRKQVIRHHLRTTGHEGLTVIMADDQKTIAEYEASKGRRTRINS